MLSVRQMNESMNAQILMIEDDERLAKMVGDYLRQSGFVFSHAADGSKRRPQFGDLGLDVARHGRPSSVPKNSGLAG